MSQLAANRRALRVLLLASCWLLVAAALPAHLLRSASPSPAPRSPLALADDLPPGDAYEPDQYSDRARQIESGSTTRHSIAPAGDEDWTRFTLYAPAAVLIEARSSLTAPPLALDLNDASAEGGLHTLHSTTSDVSGILRQEYHCESAPLPAGSYHTRLYAAQPDTRIADYTLRITIAPCPFLTESHLVLTHTPAAQPAASAGQASASFAIFGGGGGGGGTSDDLASTSALTWTASTSTSWLHLDRQQGVVPAVVNAQADPASLPAGVHSGTISVTTRRSAAPLTLPVTLVVAESQASGRITDQQGNGLPDVQVAIARIDGIEITQAVQDPAHSVPLVAGRPTIARVYAHGSSPFPLGLKLTARPGSTAPAAASALLHSLPLGSATLSPTRTSRADYQHSFNTLLPADWTQPGAIELAASFDSPGDVGATRSTKDGRYQLNLPPGTYTLIPSRPGYIFDPPTRTIRVPANASAQDFSATARPLPHRSYLPIIKTGAFRAAPPDEAAVSNGSSQRVTFEPLPPLALRLVPITLHDTASSTTFTPPTNLSRISDHLLRSYPISALDLSIRPGAALTTTVSPDDMRALAFVALDYLTDLKLADGAPDWQVYYGLFSYPVPSGGWGLQDQRVSVSPNRDSTHVVVPGDLIAHEIGHNFGLSHAPCGTIDRLDARYPYTDGVVGEYGLNLGTRQVISPHEPDIMSYCRPAWFSDYHYRQLYADQRINGGPLPGTRAALPADRTSLLIRAAFAPDGSVALRPAYAIARHPTGIAAHDSDYQAELLDSAGRVVAAYPLAIAEMTHMQPPGRRIAAAVPLPAAPVARLRLRERGQVIAERALHSGPPTALHARLSRTPDNRLHLRWNASDTPVLVRYTHDQGQTWTTLALDATGSLLLDPATLPGGTGRFALALADHTSLPAAPAQPLTLMLPDSPPEAWISGPSFASAGQPVVLSGQASDQEDGALTRISWRVNGEAIEAGQVLTLANEPGSYAVELHATDSSGQSVRATHQLTVVP